MNFVKYQCTICRRTKSFSKNDTHVQPDQCVITKGCLGRLSPVGEASYLQSTPSVVGVEDWYPRGEVAVEVKPTVPEQFALSTSSTGTLTFAIQSDTPNSLPLQLYAELIQKKIGVAEYSQYLYKVSNEHQFTTTIIAGKDSNGKNMRFDSAAITEERVTVRVNGVINTSYTLTPNKITFTTLLPINTLVDVVVVNDTTEETKQIIFTRNSSLIPSLVRGSWSNVNFVEKLGPTGIKTWYLYSADSLGSLNGGKIKFGSNQVNDEGIFLLASTPYQSVDRYLNFCVLQQDMMQDFEVNFDDGQLYFNKITEFFPPFTIPIQGYLADDLYTVSTSSAVIDDTELARFKGKKILGPV